MSSHLTEEQYQSGVKAVWKSTLWLSIITVVEVVIALTFGHILPKMVLNLFCRVYRTLFSPLLVNQRR